MIQQVFSDGMIWSTLPETNSEFTLENRPKPTMKIPSELTIDFKGLKNVSFKEGNIS